MGTYHFSRGNYDNPHELDLSLFKDHGVTCAVGVSGIFIEKIGFGNNPVIGLHVAHNCKEDHGIDGIVRALNRMIDIRLEAFGVPMSAILRARPTWGSHGRQMTLKDTNPNSTTKGNRKRLNTAVTYRAFRETGTEETPAFQRHTISQALACFDWYSSARWIFPRDDNPEPNRFGGKHGVIRADLLSVKS